jgi:hypothetical protein
MNLEQKVDRILLLIEGQGESSPGALQRIKTIEDDIYGVKGFMGVKNQVRIIWRAYVWLLCTASAIVGSVGTVILYKYVHLNP